MLSIYVDVWSLVRIDGRDVRPYSTLEAKLAASRVAACYLQKGGASVEKEYQWVSATHLERVKDESLKLYVAIIKIARN